MKRNPKTGEQMAESISEAGNFFKAEKSGSAFRKILNKMLHGKDLPVTHMTQFERHQHVLAALRKTPDTPDINKIYKFIIGTISHICSMDKSRKYAYIVVANTLKTSVDNVIEMEKEAKKVVQAAQMGDYFKGVIQI